MRIHPLRVPTKRTVAHRTMIWSCIQSDNQCVGGGMAVAVLAAPLCSVVSRRHCCPFCCSESQHRRTRTSFSPPSLEKLKFDHKNHATSSIKDEYIVLECSARRRSTRGVSIEVKVLSGQT